MKTIRFVLWFAILVAYLVVTMFYPESDQTARTVCVIVGAIVETVYRIRRREPVDDPISPEPIRSLNLTKRS